MSKKLRRTNKFTSDQKAVDISLIHYMEKQEVLFIKIAAFSALAFAIVATFFGAISIGKSSNLVKQNDLLLKKIKADSIIIVNLQNEKEQIKAIQSKMKDLEIENIAESERADKIVDRIDYIEGMTYEEHLYYIIKNKKKK